MTGLTAELVTLGMLTGLALAGFWWITEEIRGRVDAEASDALTAEAIDLLPSPSPATDRDRAAMRGLAAERGAS